METVLRGGNVVDPSQQCEGRFDILIGEGLVVDIAKRISTTGRVIENIEGYTVIPGLIDVHTHLREPGGEAKETIVSASRAAAAGGYTSITALPNTNPVTDDARKVEHLRALIDHANLVRIWPIGAVTKDSAGEKLAEIAQMVAMGIRAVTDDGHGVQSAESVRQALCMCAELKIPLLQHCEDETLAGQGQVHDGQIALQLGLPGISASSETVMLVRDVVLAQACKARLHIMHVSSAQAVQWLRMVKSIGIQVTAEVTPHHLLLTESAVVDDGAMAKMKPPLRTKADRKALQEALVDGTIDLIATDHAPHTVEEKTGDFSAAPFGIVGLETAFPILYTHLVKKDVLSLTQLVDRMSCRPAALLGLPYGTLKPGYAADLTILDLEQERTIDKDKFYSKGKNTPFHAWPVYGMPVLTMVGGRVVMKNGIVTI
ncbi:MAG: dihydroorotase [Firmicutes bacterium]|nr:dihydroorotase [Bacillota bacterium]